MSYGNYPSLQDVKKILVIKLRHHGDVLLSTPVFSFLKSKLPHAEIDGLIYQETAPMLQGHPAIRQLHLYDKEWKKKSFFRRWVCEISLLIKLRKEKYDLIINLTEGDRGALVALFSGAPIRVGFNFEKKGFWGKSRAFSHLAKLCKTPRHAVEKNLDALRRIGLFPEAHEKELLFHIPAEMRNTISSKLPYNYIVIHPGSRWKFKCWPAKHVADLIRKLHAENHSIVLTASPDPAEIDMIQEIIALCPQVPILNLAGQTSLKELGAVIEKARMLICVDSVPLHLASALKTPVIALFGPTSEHNWGPWQHPFARVVTQPFSCRPCGMDGCGGSKRSDCLVTLTPESVKTVVQQLYQELSS